MITAGSSSSNDVVSAPGASAIGAWVMSTAQGHNATPGHLGGAMRVRERERRLQRDQGIGKLACAPPAVG